MYTHHCRDIIVRALPIWQTMKFRFGLATNFVVVIITVYHLYKCYLLWWSASVCVVYTLVEYKQYRHTYLWLVALKIAESQMSLDGYIIWIN